MEASKKTGFTLIELLVVVTIIVVLLALLTPALEKAIYQAELATCGGNFKGMGNTLITYASNNKRFYPRRASATYTPNYIHGDELMFRQLFPINKMLNDPASPKVDMENAKPGLVFASQHMYFSFKFSGEKGVNRIGDRLPWKGVSVNILAADQDQILAAQGWATSGHPDNEGRMTPEAWQDQPQGEGTLLPGNIGTDNGVLVGFATYAYWIGRPWQRGPVDFNYLHDDLSVRRFTNVAWDDDRMWAFPLRAGDLGPVNPSTPGTDYYTLLPK